MKHVTASLTIASCLLLAAAGTAFATPHGPPSPGYPNGTPTSNPTTGHKGAPTHTCGSTATAIPPGNSGSAPGSPFNPSGQAGSVYAGNPGTASLANSNSTAAVAQYDNACFH
jgi:hypothetical protein